MGGMWLTQTLEGLKLEIPDDVVLSKDLLKMMLVFQQVEDDDYIKFKFVSVPKIDQDEINDINSRVGKYLSNIIVGNNVLGELVKNQTFLTYCKLLFNPTTLLIIVGGEPDGWNFNAYGPNGLIGLLTLLQEGKNTGFAMYYNSEGKEWYAITESNTLLPLNSPLLTSIWICKTIGIVSIRNVNNAMDPAFLNLMDEIVLWRVLKKNITKPEQKSG